MRQWLGKHDRSRLFASQSEASCCAETQGSDDRPHLRLGIGVQPYTVFAVPVKIAEHGIVAGSRQAEIRISSIRSHFFHTSLQGKQLQYPGKRLVFSARIRVMRPGIAVVRLVSRD